MKLKKKVKKACYNVNCSSYEDQIKYTEDYSFCPKCASKLSFVCSDKRCYHKLENKRREYCDECLLKREQKKIKNKENRSNIVKHLPGFITGAIGIASSAQQIGKNIKPLTRKK